DITGWQDFALTIQGSTRIIPILILDTAPALLFSRQRQKDYVFAVSEEGALISPDHPAEAGQTIKVYATGLNLEAPIVPPSEGNSKQVIAMVLGSGVYPLLQAAPFAPGVYELTAQLPDSLAAGDHGITILGKGILFSGVRVLLPVGSAKQSSNPDNRSAL